MKKIENKLFLEFEGQNFILFCFLNEIPKYFCKKSFGIRRASLARNQIFILKIFGLTFFTNRKKKLALIKKLNYIDFIDFETGFNRPIFLCFLKVGSIPYFSCSLLLLIIRGTIRGF